MKYFKSKDILQEMRDEGYKIQGYERIFYIIEGIVVLFLKARFFLRIGNWRIGMSREDYQAYIEEKKPYVTTIKDFSRSAFPKIPPVIIIPYKKKRYQTHYTLKQRQSYEMEYLKLIDDYALHIKAMYYKDSKLGKAILSKENKVSSINNLNVKKR